MLASSYALSTNPTTLSHVQLLLALFLFVLDSLNLHRPSVYTWPCSTLVIFLYTLCHWTPHPLPQYLALYLSAFACAQFFIIFCLPISFPSLTSSQRAIHDRNSAPTPRSLHGLKAIFTQLLRAASHDEEAQATTTPRPRTAGNQLRMKQAKALAVAVRAP
jgi:hypothetical protein